MIRHYSMVSILIISRSIAINRPINAFVKTIYECQLEEANEYEKHFLEIYLKVQANKSKSIREL